MSLRHKNHDMNGFSVGERVRVIDSYNLEVGIIVGFGLKKIKVRLESGFSGVVSYLPEKMAKLDEKIVVVCNYVGRSCKYRIERTLYKDFHLEASLIGRQSRIYESDGILTSTDSMEYLKEVYNSNVAKSALMELI